MSKIKKMVIFRAMSVVLIIALTALDITWAYPSDSNRNYSTLGVPSVGQRDPVSEDAEKFQRSVFQDANALTVVCGLAELLFNDSGNTLNDAINELSIELRERDIYGDLIRTEIICVHDGMEFRIEPTAQVPPDAVARFRYSKDGQCIGWIEIAPKGSKTLEMLPGIELQYAPDDYAIKLLPINYDGSKQSLASSGAEKTGSEAATLPQQETQSPDNNKGQGSSGTLLSLNHPVISLTILALSPTLSMIRDYALSHPVITLVAATLTGFLLFLVILRYFSPSAWHLFRLMHGSDGYKVRHRDALVKVGQAAVPYLLKALRSKDGAVRVYAVVGLGRILPVMPIAFKALKVSALIDTDTWVRIGAIRSMKNVVDSDVADALINGLWDDNRDARIEVVKALEELKDPRAIEPLIHVLSDSEIDIRFLAARALEGMGWVPGDIDDRIALNIAKQDWDELTRIGSPATYRLVQYLADSNFDLVRKKVAATLIDINDYRLKPLTDYLKSVRDHNITYYVMLRPEQIKHIADSLERGAALMVGYTPFQVHNTVITDKDNRPIMTVEVVDEFARVKFLDLPSDIQGKVQELQIGEFQKREIKLNSSILPIGIALGLLMSDSTLSVLSDFVTANIWSAPVMSTVMCIAIACYIIAVHARILPGMRIATVARTGESNVTTSLVSDTEARPSARSIAIKPDTAIIAKRLSDTSEAPISSNRARFIVAANELMDNDIGSSDAIAGAATGRLTDGMSTVEIAQKVETAIKDIENRWTGKLIPERTALRLKWLNDNIAQFEAEGLTAYLRVLARRAKLQGNQRLIIGLETDWIPGVNEKGGFQHMAIKQLMKEMYEIGDTLKRKHSGMDNVVVVRGSGEGLKRAILEVAAESKTSLHNVVVIASVDTIDNNFIGLAGTDSTDKPFLSAINSDNLIEQCKDDPEIGRVTSKQLKIVLTRIIYTTLEWVTRNKPPHIPWITYKEEKNMLIFNLPKVDPEDYGSLQKKYDCELSAILAA